MGVLWVHFGVLLGNFWGTLGVPLGHFETPFFGATLRLSWGLPWMYAELTFEVLKDYFGSALKVTFGVFWVYFEGTLGVTLGLPSSHLESNLRSLWQ